jgi:hypothetical protein
LVDVDTYRAWRVHKILGEQFAARYVSRLGFRSQGTVEVNGEVSVRIDGEEAVTLSSFCEITGEVLLMSKAI